MIDLSRVKPHLSPLNSELARHAIVGIASAITSIVGPSSLASANSFTQAPQAGTALDDAAKQARFRDLQVGKFPDQLQNALNAVADKDTETAIQGLRYFQRWNGREDGDGTILRAMVQVTCRALADPRPEVANEAVNNLNYLNNQRINGGLPKFLLPAEARAPLLEQALILQNMRGDPTLIAMCGWCEPFGADADQAQSQFIDRAFGDDGLTRVCRNGAEPQLVAAYWKLARLLNTSGQTRALKLVNDAIAEHGNESSKMGQQYLIGLRVLLGDISANSEVSELCDRYLCGAGSPPVIALPACENVHDPVLVEKLDKVFTAIAQEITAGTQLGVSLRRVIVERVEVNEWLAQQVYNRIAEKVLATPSFEERRAILERLRSQPISWWADTPHVYSVILNVFPELLLKDRPLWNELIRSDHGPIYDRNAPQLDNEIRFQVSTLEPALRDPAGKVLAGCYAALMRDDNPDQARCEMINAIVAAIRSGNSSAISLGEELLAHRIERKVSRAVLDKLEELSHGSTSELQVRLWDSWAREDTYLQLSNFVTPREFPKLVTFIDTRAPITEPLSKSVLSALPEKAIADDEPVPSDGRCEEIAMAVGYYARAWSTLEEKRRELVWKRIENAYQVSGASLPITRALKRLCDEVIRVKDARAEAAQLMLTKLAGDLKAK